MTDFTSYDSIDFLNNDSFIRWLLKLDIKDKEFWDAFVENHPDKKEAINEAIEIFNQFNFEHQELTLPEIFEVWNNIEYQAKKRRNTNARILKYAAVFILVFCTGAFSYYLFSKTTAQNDFQAMDIASVATNQAQIISSNGATIPLASRDSEIKYDAAGEKIIVDNDTIEQQNPTESPVTNRVIIPYGRSSQLTLSDGTQVWLNAGSQLIYPSVFSDKQREVLLIGEAFFNVVKNEQKPFVVRTEPADITVYGTSFDVSAYPDDPIFQTVLVSGSVGIETKRSNMFSRSDKQMLKPNQMFALDKTSYVNTINRVKVVHYTSWKEGMINCEKQDLSRVVRLLERYYNQRIRIKDPLLGTYKISGKLDLKNDISEVLDVLSAFVPIDWGQKQNGEYFIVEPN